MKNFKDILLSFFKYKEALSRNLSHEKRVGEISSSLGGGGRVSSSFTRVEINEDWVSLIEEGLPYFAKAIAQNRQFILRDGNVVPIEKAKKASKESAQYLAKHSESVKDDGMGGITPSELYIKENQSNFAVYENRFLYTALCYVRDFVDIRYGDICRLEHTGCLTLSSNASFHIKDKRYTYDLCLKEESRGIDIEGLKNGEYPMIGRIERSRLLISELLSSQLMTEMSKEPLVKDPITVTNVLKTDTAFHSVFMLYTKLTLYKEKGYTVKEQKREVSPLPKELADSIAQTLILQSALTNAYEKGLDGDISAYLSLIELEGSKDEAERRAELCRRLKADGGKSEDYIRALEEYVIFLEKKDDLTKELTDKYEKIDQRIFEVRTERDELSKKAELLSKEIKDCKESAEAELFGLKTEWKADIQRRSFEYEQRIASLLGEVEVKKAELKAKEAELFSCKEQKHLLGALLVSAKERLGEKHELDYSTKEAFDLLEAEKNAFDRFFETTWKSTKKKIREKYFKRKK